MKSGGTLKDSNSPLSRKLEKAFTQSKPSGKHKSYPESNYATEMNKLRQGN
jgi:hypothetical protein